nr:Do family serine endopeptidase [Brevundimonas sp. UBA7534]
MMKTRSILLATALALSACGNPDNSKAQEGVFAEQPRVVPGDSAAMKASFAPVVRQAAPAVVNIAARGVQRVQSADPFFQLFGPQARVAQSVGSGVIVRADGTVVTNYHVIEGMSEIKVVLNDRREFPAEVVLADQRSDIAVLKLQGVDGALPFLRIDDQEEQQIGDLVLAIGNPFGVGQTVTNGIISALNRTETGISDSGSFIQTDAAINPGNSGGALVDMDGDLIGINTAIFSRSGTSSGVGFAVPAVMVKRVVDSAVGGATTVVRPWLGVKGDTVSSDIAGSLGLDRPQGLVVTDVYPDSPASRAGISQGDVVTAVDGVEINDQGGLNYRIGTKAPNDTVQVTVLRDGRAQTLNARVQALPGDAKPGDGSTVSSGSLAGLRIVPLNPAFADSLGGDPFLRGVLVTGVARGSLPARIGVRPRDVIRRIDGREVASVSDLQRARAGSEVVILRGGRELTGRMPG